MIKNIKKQVRKLKRFMKVVLGLDLSVPIQINVTKERFGSEYGGWDVCINEIDSSSIIYSFGIGEDASFDIDMINRFGCTIEAFDPTPKSIAWISKQNIPKFVMHEYGIADFDGKITFNPPDNPNHISHTILERPSTQNQSIDVNVKKLSSIMTELGHESIDILKMDIEGAEYQVLDDIEKSNIRPSQILIEFHHRFKNVGISKTKSAFIQLNRMGYKLFSISSTGEEFSFIKT